MLKIGFGLGFLAKGLKKNHVDGIGVYSQQLYKALSSQNIELLPYVYGQYDLTDFPKSYTLHPSFLRHVLAYELFHQKIECQLNFKPQLIHAPDHLIPRVKNTPVVATVMDLIPFIHPEWTRGRMRTLKNYLFKKTILSADHIITISEYSKKDLMAYFDIPEEKISVTYLGVNASFFERISEEEKQQVLKKLNLNDQFFLFVGTLQARKNIEIALDAHALLSFEERKTHPFVIVGNAGWANISLLEKIQRGEEQGVVRWLKYLPDYEVKCLLQSALALVYVSLYEGFGLPIVEAFASECPVLTSKVTSIPEVAGDAAILVNPCDVQEITVAMQKLIYSWDLKQDLKKKGLERANNLTWENCAKLTSDVYKTMV